MTSTKVVFYVVVGFLIFILFALCYTFSLGRHFSSLLLYNERTINILQIYDWYEVEGNMAI